MQSPKVCRPFGSLDFQTLLVLGPLQKLLLPFIVRSSVSLHHAVNYITPKCTKERTFCPNLSNTLAAGYKETNLSNSYTLGFWEAFWLMTSFCSFYTDSYCSQKIQNFYCLQDYKLDHPDLQAWLTHLLHLLVFGSHWFFSVFVLSNVATRQIFFFSELVKRRPN